MTHPNQNVTLQTIAPGICKDPLVTSPDALVRTVIQQMGAIRDSRHHSPTDLRENLHRDARASCAIVMAQGRPVGLLTETDLVALHRSEQAASLTVGDCMTPSVLIVQSDEPLLPICQQLTAHCLQHAIVENAQGALVGIVTPATLMQVLNSPAIEPSTDQYPARSQFLESPSPECPTLPASASAHLQPTADTHHSEARLRQILESIHDWVWEIDEHGMTTYCGPQVRDLLGYEPEDLMGRSLDVFMDASEVERIGAILQGFAENHQCFHHLTATLRHKEGHAVTIESSGGPIFGHDNSFRGFIGVDRDVSAIKQVANRLESYNRLLVDIARDESLEQILGDISQMAEEYLSQGKALFLLLDENQYFHAQGTPHLPPVFVQSIDGIQLTAEEIGPCTAAVLRKQVVISDNLNTETRWPEFACLALEHGLQACWSFPIIANNDGRVLGTFAAYYQEPQAPNSTEFQLMSQLANLAEIAITKHQVAHSLQKSEDHYRSLFNQASAGILIAQNSRFVDVNDRACEMLGYDRQELIRKTIEEITHPDDHHRIEPDRRRLDAGEIESYRKEKRYLRQDGSSFWGALEVNLIRDLAGQPLYSIGLIHDISNLKAAETALNDLVKGTATTLGKDFFPALVTHISKVLNVPIALVTQFVGDELQSLALVVDGELQPNFTYDLPDTPCRDLVIDYAYHCPSHLTEQFPNHPHRARGAESYFGVALRDRQGQVIGSLCIFDRQPMLDTDYAQQLLTVFSGRAAAELERQRTDRALTHLIAGTAVTQTENFFDALVHYLTEALGVSHALIAERVGDEEITLAYCADGQPQPALSLPFDDTPCAKVYEHGAYYIELDPQQKCSELAKMKARSYLGVALSDRNGEAIGLLCIFHRQLLGDPKHAEQIMRVFAARAATELERRRADHALHSLIEGTAALTGPDFFPALVHHLADALHASHAYITQIVEGERLYHVAVWGDGEFLPHNTTDIAGSTCEVTLREGEYHCARHVTTCFPAYPALATMGVESYMGVALKDSQGQAMGTLCIYTRQPIVDPPKAQAILRVFAARAAAELERLQAQSTLEQLNAELEQRVEQRTQELARSQQDLQTIFDNTYEAIVVHDSDGTILNVNNRCLEMLGATREQILASDISDFAGPDAPIAQIPALIQRVWMGEDVRLEWQDQRLDDGTTFDVDVSLRKVTLGNRPVIIASASDISDRKATELQLQALNRRYELFFEGSQSGLVFWNIIDDTAEVSLRFVQIFGSDDTHHPELTNFTAFAQRIHPEDLPQVQAALQAHFERQESYSIEYRVRHLAGHLVWVWATGQAVWDDAGRPVQMFIAVQEISDRKGAELRLRDLNKRNELIFEGSQAGLIFWDIVNDRAEMSRICGAIFGYNAEQSTTSFAEFKHRIHPEDLPTVEAAVRAHLEEQIPYKIEYRYRHQAGEYIWLYVCGKAIWDDHGHPTYMGISVQDISDRKQAEALLRQRSEELARSERDLRTIFNNVYDGISIHDLDGTILDVNERFSEMLGTTKEQLLGCSVADYSAPESPINQLANLSQLVQQGRELKIEWINRRFDNGQTFAAEVSLKQLMLGNRLVIIACTRDISDRKAAESELQRLSGRLELALESAEIGIWEWNFQTEELAWDDRMLAIHGVQREEFRGTFQDWADRVHPDDFSQASPDLSDDSWDNCINEFRIIRPDGTIRHIYSATLRQRDEAGKIARCVGINMDISDRKAAIEQIRASEQRYASLAAAAPVGIFRTDALGNGTYLSETWCRIAGLTQEEALGEGWKQALHPDDRDKVAAEWYQSMQENRPAQIECRFQRPDGAVSWVYEQSVAEYNAAGEIIGCVGTITDITAQKAAEVQLAQTNAELLRATRLKDEFLANMSHEIRTPMNAILGMTELALGTTLTLQQRNYLNKIKTSAGLLLHIINDILDFSKIEAGKLTLETTPFSLDSVLNNLHSVNSLAAQRKKLKLTFEVESNTPRQLVGDPLRLGQVLLNLVSNAIKFTEQGSVTIAVRPVTTMAEGCSLQFSVTDTGIGISPAQKAKLFQTFIQGDASTTRRFGGTGLGLIISQRLVHLMQGEIGMESTQEQGSTFWFTAVFQRPTERPELSHLSLAKTITRTQKWRGPYLNGLRILLVEDNDINQELALEFLTQAGAHVHIARNGQEAYDTVQQAEFDVVLMDCQMPIMDGYVATRLIRALPQKGDIPIIAMTANAMSGDRQKCLDAGMTDYIAKPIVKENLFALIAQVIEQSSFSSQNSKAFPVTPMSSISEFNTLTLFNVELGLRYAGNNPQLYAKLLHRFLAQYPSFNEQINHALQAEDYAEATRLTHTLKGLCGTLGCLDLQHQAQILEYNFQEHKNNFDQSVLSTLIGTLNQVLVELEAWSQAQAKQSTPTLSLNTIDWQTVKQLINRMEAALDTDLGTAFADLESLQTLLRSDVETNTVVAKLTTALDDFNLDDARENLAALRELTQTHL